MERIAELKVFITTTDASCSECGEQLGRGAWITLIENKGVLCLSCADLDHLIFLPSGAAALTRRARKHSTLAAVVLKWSRARKRYERQGLLVEEQALAQAEQECLADSEVRERRREREAARRAELDPTGRKDAAKAWADQVIRDWFFTLQQEDLHGGAPRDVIWREQKGAGDRT